MKNQVGFIGVGQCGSNIVALMESMDYKCCYINTSKEDLNSLKNAKHKIHIKNGEGASKNRKAVLKLASESINDIVNSINNIITQQYVFIAFSAGGGTGSGLGTFLSSYMAHTDKVVIPIVVLPDDIKESVKTCENAYNCCYELSSIENLGAIFLLDNSKNEDKFWINQQFSRELDAMLNMTTVSSYGNIDVSEIKTMISTPGIAMISKLSKAKSTASQILNSFNDNIYTEITSKSPSIVGISSCNKSLNYNDVINEFPCVYDVFTGVSDNRTVIMLCGMQWPMDRLLGYKKKVENLKVENKKISFSPLNNTKQDKLQYKQNTPIDSRSLLMSFLNN